MIRLKRRVVACRFQSSQQLINKIIKNNLCFPLLHVGFNGKKMECKEQMHTMFTSILLGIGLCLNLCQQKPFTLQFSRNQILRFALNRVDANVLRIMIILSWQIEYVNCKKAKVCCKGILRSTKVKNGMVWELRQRNRDNSKTNHLYCRSCDSTIATSCNYSFFHIDFWENKHSKKFDSEFTKIRK